MPKTARGTFEPNERKNGKTVDFPDAAETVGMKTRLRQSGILPFAALAQAFTARRKGKSPSGLSPNHNSVG
jgi:hypothetical protein